MTQTEARKRVYQAAADTLEGMGLLELVSPREFSDATPEDRRWLLDAFHELLMDVRGRADAMREPFGTPGFKP